MDLNQLEDANRRLTDRCALKDEFVAKVCHELRTPLTAIKEGISLVLDGALGEINAEQRDFLGTVDQSIDRLTEMITNMLDLSKIEAGRLRLLRRRLPVRRLLDTAVASYRPVIDPRRVIIEDGGAPDVFADPNRLMQVLGNLITNSVKFTPPEGTLTLRASRADGQVTIAVSDTGIGIAKEDLSKLFQKFSQVGAGEGRPKGTGLGLALCKELVELHKGAITVSSESGRGTTFAFTLPVYEIDMALDESFQEMIEVSRRSDHGTVGVLALSLPEGCGRLPEPLAEVTEACAEAVRTQIQRSDVVLSLEPGRIVVFVPADAEGMLAVAARLRKAVADWLSHRGIAAHPEALALGSSRYPTEGTDVRHLIHLAIGRDRAGHHAGGVVGKESTGGRRPTGMTT